MRVAASYQRESLPPIYWGHPLIEALPALLRPGEARRLLLTPPDVNIAEVRKLRLDLRPHQVANLAALFVPRPELDVIEPQLSLLLRGGYLPRNPLDVDAIRETYSVRELMRAQEGVAPTLPPCLLLTGLSGSGKTRSLNALLSMIPQVIVHTSYNGQPFTEVQVTWLGVFAPVNASLHGLLDAIYSAFDKALGLVGELAYRFQWRKKASIEAKLEVLAQIARTYHLGLLHIDDLQRIVEATESASEAALNSIIQWANVVRVPLVLSGTHKTVRLLATSMEAARRAGSAGQYEFALATSASDEPFVALTRAAFQYQWLDKSIELDEGWLEDIFYYSQGLPGLELPLLQNAQKLAAWQNDRRLTKDHLKRAYQNDFALLHPALDALRSNSPERIALYEDLLPRDAEAELRRNPKLRFK